MTTPNKPPPPNPRPRFPFAALFGFVYSFCAQPASPAAVGEPRRSAFMSISTSKPRVLTASAAALCLLGCTGPRAQRTDVWKSDSSYSRRISDPVAWSASQFSDSPNASVADARLESFEADIDHDGVSELFITSQRLHGEALGPYLCFRRSGPQF